MTIAAIRNTLLCILMLGAAAAASAQDFPSRTVKIVVPQTPGGASDALARIIGQKLSEKWGQPVVVENRAGAGGNVGTEGVATSAPDGYTLLMSYVGTQAINGALYKKLPFDPDKDFAPVATLATLPFVVVGKPDAPFRTVQDLVAAAKKDRLTYGSAGNGSVNHLLGEMFNAAAGVKLTHIPYRGAAPAMTDLMGGQIDVVFTSLPSVAGAIRSGKLQAIAVTSARRRTFVRHHSDHRRGRLCRFRRESLVRPAGAGAHAPGGGGTDQCRRERTPEGAARSPRVSPPRARSRIRRHPRSSPGC